MKKYDTREEVGEVEKILAEIFQHKKQLREMTPIISKEEKKKEEKIEKKITKLYSKVNYKRNKW